MSIDVFNVYDKQWLLLKNRVVMSAMTRGFSNNRLCNKKIQEYYDQIIKLVQNAFDGDQNQREELRKSVGLDYFKPIRWLLQLVKEANPTKFETMYKRNVKSEIQKDYESKHKFLDSFYVELRSCLGDFEKIRLLHDIIQPNELSDLNSKLKALKSEENHQLYLDRKKGLEDLFSP